MLEPYEGDINEFYVDVTVKNPKVEDDSYVSYEIEIETNNFSFTESRSSVRRRYSEFVLLQKQLAKEFPTWKLPSLPPKFPFKDHFHPTFIEKRRKGLEEFVKMLVSQRIYLSSKALHLFLQSNHPVSEIKDIILNKSIPPTQSTHNSLILNHRFPNLYSTCTLPDEISTLSLSSHTDVEASVSLFPAHNSVAEGTMPTKQDKSPAESKRVSFCDQVTVAQIFLE